MLLWKADGSELVARLVGLSERIESVRFSPDGKRLAVTGGLPGRMGEVQVWDVAEAEARCSRCRSPSTRSTAQLVARRHARSPSAAPTTRVRAIDAKTGEQVLFMGSHNDWVLDTVFSADGTHLISVGRDMTAKLTEVATQRFVDNITSITPGALKGGIAAVARHPERDEIVIGGSDGVPKLYRDLPPDDPRDRRRLQPDPRVPADARPDLQRRRQHRRQADRRRQQPRRPGEVDVYAYEFDTSLPDNIKAIMREGRQRPARPRRTPTLDEVSHGRREADSPTPIAAGRHLRRRVPPDGKQSPPPAATASSG